jgi:hypothetical protein
VKAKPLLPLTADRLSKVAVVGRLANIANTGDRGSSRVSCPEVVTPYQGLKAALPQAEILLSAGSDIDQVKTTAAGADVAICIVGYDHTDEGEFVIPSMDPELRKVFVQPTKEKEAGFAQQV